VFERGVQFQEQALVILRNRFRAPTPTGPRAYERASSPTELRPKP
jgi:hypothetical protein